MRRIGFILVLASGIPACGGSTTTSVDLATPVEPRGFGAKQARTGADGAPTATMGRTVVQGEVRGRTVRLGAAFLLTPDVEGPMELHAFEDHVHRDAVCPGGLLDEPPSVSLKIMLPDLRSGDDPEVTVLRDGEAHVPVARVRVAVTGPMRPGARVTATIDVEGSDGSHLRGVMPAYVCVDDRTE